MRQYLNEYFLVLGEARRKILVLIIYFLLSSLLDVLGIGLVASYIPVILGDTGFLSELFSKLTLIKDFEVEKLYLYLGFLIIFVYLLKAIISFDIQKRIIRFSLNVEFELRDRLLRAYLRKPYSFFLTENSSNVVNNIGVYANTFQTSTVSQSLRLIAESIVVLAIIVLLAFSNPYFTISVVFLIALFFLGYDFFVKDKMINAGKTASSRFGNIVKYINQAIFGLREIKILKKEGYFTKKLQDEVNIVNDARFVQDSLKLIPKYGIEFLLVVSTILMAVVMLYYGFDRSLILTNIAIFVVAGTRLLSSSNVLISALSTLRSGRFVVSELAKTLMNEVGHQLEIVGVNKKIEQLSWSKKIEFKNISFKYGQNDTNLFDNLSLTINKGESIGIVGESGSGKTTLVNILLNLLDYDDGQVFVDGKNFSNKKDIIQNSMAYIPQNIFLLDESIKRNIAFGVNDDLIDENLMSESLKKARLEKIIPSLPNGIETLVGERGIRFSGGQQQRLAIARALYSKREILILDEATSALDNDTEEEIVREIEQLKGKFTLVVIAHRLSTLKGCHRIISIENGKLIEQNKN